MHYSAFIYFFIAVALIAASFFTKSWVRKISITLTVLFVVIPLCFILFLAIFKTQVQRGKILPSFGPLLSLVSPPEDLWVPIASTALELNKIEYNFNLSHKYVGNHDVGISVQKMQGIGSIGNDLIMDFSLKHHDNISLSKTTQSIGTFWGRKDCGLRFLTYQVPDIVPVDKPIKAKVIIRGNIEEFISSYGEATLYIKKGSDL